jgi:hypothetical protein
MHSLGMRNFSSQYQHPYRIKGRSSFPRPSSSFKSTPEICELLQQTIQHDELLELTLRPRPDNEQCLWKSVNIRPIELRGKRLLQFSFLGPRQNIVKNHLPEDALEELEPFLNTSLSSIQLKSTHEVRMLRIAHPSCLTQQLVVPGNKHTVYTQGPVNHS